MIRNDSDLKSHCKAVGMSAFKIDGEYRIAPDRYTFPQFTSAEREAMAYYTSDRQDAADTATAMSRQLKGIQS